ncbi:hypothetical protein HYT84_03220 [Candidatus Micrarchaeota archaeon]|nr:hypothetical protein [Candidatus Micrarchaeota archaeon]
MYKKRSLRKTASVKYNQIDLISVMILLVGLFLFLAPHSIHIKVGFSYADHNTHLISGLLLITFSLGVLIWNNKWNK